MIEKALNLKKKWAYTFPANSNVCSDAIEVDLGRRPSTQSPKITRA